MSRILTMVVFIMVIGSLISVWFYQCLGSPLASIIAAISSEALEKPVRIVEEKHSKGKSRVVIEVLY